MTVRHRNTCWASALMALSLAVTACGSYEYASGGEIGVDVDQATMDAMQTAEVTPTSADAAEAKALIQPVKVMWWHSMDGELGKAAKQLAANFNAWHPAVRVEAVYQGTCDESLSKIMASTDGKSAPSLIHMCDTGSRFMIDSGAVKPVQLFMDAEGYDLSALEPTIRNLYTFEGKLYAMPFYTSGSMLYYNKALFMKAGLDPKSPPTTLDEVAEAADKLTGSGVAVDDELARGLDRKAEDARSAFINGQAAMMLDSSASLSVIVDGVSDKFEVGAAFMPRPTDADESGVLLDGASLWVMNNKPEAEQKAAWAFVKYLAEPKTQAEWYIHTGYFPITTKAYDKRIVKENMEKYPQFLTAVEQLRRTKSNAATQSAFASAGMPPKARRQVEMTIE